MKRSLLFLILLLSTVLVMAQTVDREMVVLEIGTGTWCTYCPGAAMGADDLLANGKKVAVVENHNGDSYANTYSNARNSFYGIGSFPTAVFDGNTAVVGGNHSTSMYPSYLPKYNAAIAIASPIEMTMDVTNNGLNYTATFTVTKLAGLTANSVKLFFAVTQSHILQNWQGQTHLEHVNRLMIPNQNGTLLDFTSGNTQTIVLDFAVLPAWPLEDCEFVAWLQNVDAGQGNITGTVKRFVTLQGLKRGVIDLSVAFSESATSINTGETVTFTNETTGGYIGVPETYNWIFEGGTPASSTQENPVVTYDLCGTYDVMLVVDRGGQIDTIIKPDLIQVGPQISVTATPGDSTCWYTPIRLDATTTGAVSYLWQPGGYTTPYIDVTYLEHGLGQHDFSVTVDLGNCQSTKMVSAYLDACTGLEEKGGSLSVAVYPNPSNGLFSVEIGAGKSITADVTVTSSLGVQVYAETGVAVNGTTVKSLDLSKFGAGIYLLTVQHGDSKVSRKIMVK